MRFSYLFFSLFLAMACQNQPASKTETTTTQNMKTTNPLVEKLGAKQILVVKTTDFDVIQGRLQAYEWAESGQWQPLTDAIDVVVGGKGLAWGAGLQDVSFNQAPFKKEGDKKSPAGIFYLSSLFGYAPQSEVGALKMPYVQADANLFCVDDAQSQYYNQIVSTTKVKKDWKSAENMLMDRNLYKYGVVVDYNFPNPEAGRGSCIFVHIWQDNQHGTAGCTAMPEDKMKNLIHLLDKTKRPVLVQCTEGGYEGLKKTYGLP
ncbi:MAG: L,D-transpeptidase family protein [Saprospiraceae bacterium]|nr:L,D-transpeptidase family protein [Saprospiraceae bacterium]